MRRWMSIITVAALALALVAGWGIGQLAGGGDGGEQIVVRPLATLDLTPTVAPEPTSRATPVVPAVASPATARTAPADVPIAASPDTR